MLDHPPASAVHTAPALLTRLQGYESLHADAVEYGGLGLHALDPRGPSLWMGSCGSATQAHYDVADNVLVQLHGSKRVRCFHPGAAWALHVFPDAHPRARKSQVNFDAPDHRRFPHFARLPMPVLDVVLSPGDALWIPAFWFHHLENCPQAADAGDLASPASVSLNIFAISQPMLAAQQIFQERRPFGSGPLTAAAAAADATAERQDKHGVAVPSVAAVAAVAALHTLGWGLLHGLGCTDPAAFVRSSLLETRYRPLLWADQNNLCIHEGSNGDDGDCDGDGDRLADSRGAGAVLSRQLPGWERQQQLLTVNELELAAACISRLLPQFKALQALSATGAGDDDATLATTLQATAGVVGVAASAPPAHRDGLVSLVVCHLFELWAVELLGAEEVQGAWEAALCFGEAQERPQHHPVAAAEPQ